MLIDAGAFRDRMRVHHAHRFSCLLLQMRFEHAQVPTTVSMPKAHGFMLVGRLDYLGRWCKAKESQQKLQHGHVARQPQPLLQGLCPSWRIGNVPQPAGCKDYAGSTA